jgi:hypothetical protein
MAGRFDRSRAERSNAIGLLASFIVVAAGLCGAIVISTIAAPEPHIAIGAAIAVFLLIAAFPISSSIKRNRDASRVYHHDESIFMRAWNRLIGKTTGEKVEIRPWKVKRRKRIPQNAESIFLADRVGRD